MFDISWAELMIVAVVAIIIVGPKELPAMLRTVGKMFGQVRRTAREFQNTFNDALREAERQAALDDVKKDLDEVRRLDPTKDLRSSLSAAQRDLKAAVAPPAAGAKAPEAKAAPSGAPAAAATGEATTTPPAAATPAPAEQAAAASTPAAPTAAPEQTVAAKPVAAAPVASPAEERLSQRPVEGSSEPARPPEPVPAEGDGVPRLAVGERR